MIRTAVVAFPLGVVGAVGARELSAGEIVVLLLFSILFLIEMEVFYAYFLRPRVVEPIARRVSRRREEKRTIDPE